MSQQLPKLSENLSIENLTVIKLTKCPYCTEWINEDADLCCKDCTPKIEADLIVVDLTNDINKLNECKIQYLHLRYFLLKEAYDKFTKIIEEIK